MVRISCHVRHDRTTDGHPNMVSASVMLAVACGVSWSTVCRN
jgi:hypothetical protein